MSLFTRAERDFHFSKVLASLPEWSDLKKRVRNCQRQDYWSGNTYYCRTYGCPCCRAIEIGKHQKRLKSRYAQANRDKMMSITVCFPPDVTPEEVGRTWTRARKQMNYLVAKMRKISSRWLSFDMAGVLEVLPFTVDELPLMGSKQQEMLAEITDTGPLFAEAPLWMGHIHAIAYAPDLDWQEVQEAFRKVWPHAHQVHVEPFYDWKDKDASIETLAFYQLKYQPGRILMNGRFCWPVEWMGELYEWAQAFSRSYQSFKFSIGGKKRRTAIETLRGLASSLERDRFSRFPIPYTDPAPHCDPSAEEAISIVDLPLDHAHPESARVRLELEEWCRNHCLSEWQKVWLVGSETARFFFKDDAEAVFFKLRFSELLSGGT